MALTVTDYRALWDVKNNKGGIAIKIQGGKTLTIKIDNHSQFVALRDLLENDNVVFARQLFPDTAP